MKYVLIAVLTFCVFLGNAFAQPQSPLILSTGLSKKSYLSFGKNLYSILGLLIYLLRFGNKTKKGFSQRRKPIDAFTSSHAGASLLLARRGQPTGCLPVGSPVAPAA